MSEDDKGKKRVMMVDDEPDITAAFVRGIKIDAIAILPFNDPVEALEEFRRSGTSYDLIISDIRMPNMNGFQLCREVKKIREDIPFWLLSGFEITRDEASELFPHVMIDRFIRKPASVREIREMIRQDILGAPTRPVGRPRHQRT